jgi:hypothetical protein
VALAGPAVKVARVVAVKAAGRWAVAEKWEVAQGGPVAAAKVAGKWVAVALAVPVAACKIMQSLLKT